jgi:hypothetical protein
MALALLKVPLSVLALLVVDFAIFLAVVGLLLVRSRVLHPQLQLPRDGAGDMFIRGQESHGPPEHYHGAAALMTLLLLVILSLDHPFAGRSQVETEPFVRLL